MSENCPNSMVEDKEGKEEKKEETKKPHFMCEINYAPHQNWRTDFIFGQRGSDSHGHMATSGAAIWNLKDEQGNEIIVDGNVVPMSTSQSQSDCKPDTSEESPHPEPSPSENEAN